jgi:hypothetical protein
MVDHDTLKSIGGDLDKLAEDAPPVLSMAIRHVRHRLQMQIDAYPQWGVEAQHPEKTCQPARIIAIMETEAQARILQEGMDGEDERVTRRVVVKGL